MKIKVCPTSDLEEPIYGPEGEQLRGCGSMDIIGPDSEGLYDCCNCGIWFRDPDEIEVVEVDCCQHDNTEDCMFCATCGECSESLNDDDVCADCFVEEGK